MVNFCHLGDDLRNILVSLDLVKHFSRQQVAKHRENRFLVRAKSIIILPSPGELVKATSLKEMGSLKVVEIVIAKALHHHVIEMLASTLNYVVILHCSLLVYNQCYFYISYAMDDFTVE